MPSCQHLHPPVRAAALLVLTCLALAACGAVSGTSSQDKEGTFQCSRGVRQHIPLWAVDDGVCDCCDGEDESGLRTPCISVCARVEADALAAHDEKMKMWKHVAKIAGQHKKGDPFAWVQAELAVWEREKARIVSEARKLPEHKHDTLLPAYNRAHATSATLERLRAAPPVSNRAPLLPRLLGGTCLNITRGEKVFKGGSFGSIPETYTFVVCPYTFVEQFKTLNDRVSLGTFVRVNVAEDPVPALVNKFKRIGTATHPAWQFEDMSLPITMQFEAKQPCPNGLPRSSTVHFICSYDTSLLEVNENGMCLYEFLIATPAACMRTRPKKPTLKPRDEL